MRTAAARPERMPDFGLTGLRRNAFDATRDFVVDLPVELPASPRSVSKWGNDRRHQAHSTRSLPWLLLSEGGDKYLCFLPPCSQKRNLGFLNNTCARKASDAVVVQGVFSPVWHNGSRYDGRKRRKNTG